MRMVVTGTQGQVVTALQKLAETHDVWSVTAIGRPGLDLSATGPLDQSFAAAKPDVIVNAAAWTAVDLAETEREDAFAVNESGAKRVAEAAKALDVPIIHISTDYVFSGDKDSAYVETDTTAPQGVYGASKLAGEVAVANAQPRHAILRTAWVYSETGKNFLKTMLRVAKDRDALNVVDDQYGTPTHADEIARGIFDVATQLVADEVDDKHYGVFHMTCNGRASWCDFAKAIFAESAKLNGPTATVSPIPSSAYPTPAKRPTNSVLDCSRLDAVYGIRLADWKEPIAETVRLSLS